MLKSATPQQMQQLDLEEGVGHPVDVLLHCVGRHHEVLQHSDCSRHQQPVRRQQLDAVLRLQACACGRNPTGGGGKPPL